jgi:formylglycine-generating enzyme required for sulfatase activity
MIRPASALAGLALALLMQSACSQRAADTARQDAVRACLAVGLPDPARPADGMVWIPGGTVRLGADDGLPEEAPVRTVEVAGFWMARHEVTQGEFAAFVAATGYRTLAERADPTGQQRSGGGAVFAPGEQVRDWSDLSAWWRLDMNASWRTPSGSRQVAQPSATEPVVQIAFADAQAYARWRGHELPTEAQWEWAARGGLAAARYVWGDTARPGGRVMANHWQGVFPVHDTIEDGYAGRAPVGCFAANGYGLFDMAGNVWEWTRDGWVEGGQPMAGMRVIKGGSYLCSDRFCHRYRPAARQPGDETFSTEHLGLRTIWTGPPPPQAENSPAGLRP